MRRSSPWLGIVAALGVACSSSEDPAAKAPADAGADTGQALGWAPGTVYPTPRAPGPRGWLDRRGLVHAHSVYSHDACDGEPKNDAGEIDGECLDDFRRDVCTVQHDFVMLSDHRESFASTEYPETLLYRPARGDTLVERGGGPVASRLACPESDPVLVMAGCESGTMPVGLERHVETPTTRGDVYGASTPEAIATLKAAGAIVLVAHTEDWTPEQLTTLPLDGFEMYNLHANLFANVGAALGLLTKLTQPELLPHPDLILLPLISEDPRYLETWGTVLAGGARRVTTVGTDCHRNSFPQLLPDGERVDSYRRMMGWFSNHVLVRPRADGTWTDLELKEGLAAGRLYGAFEVLGFPVGFDFHATAGEIHEMGEEVSLASTPELVVHLPSVQELGAGTPAPELTARILLAREGGWDEVHSSQEDTSFRPTLPGAYRAEIRMRPRHLAPHLSSYASLAEGDFVWIYSNPIYLVP
ncbi:MAG: hypothetical protein IT376_11820 [Polyangiaceae bacterium]|nr:hypothetical protein [Polyangiaceae bacterium]